MLLYEAYQAQCDVLAPLRLAADAARGFLDHAWLGFADLPLLRGASAALNLFSDARLRHEHPGFGIARVTVDGREVAVAEEAAALHPFCRLLHFRKEEAVPDQPRVLIVAPLSGHFATLLRGTVETMLPDHDVYLTDWINARNVPRAHGNF